MSGDLLGWLERLPEADLVELLTVRPDTLRGRPPSDLTDLAERLIMASSLGLVLSQQARPQLQLIQAALALGQDITRRDLVELLASDGSSDGSEHHRQVDRVIDGLCRVGVLIESDGRLSWPVALLTFFDSPLNLGRPAAILLAGQSVDALRRLQTALGLPRTANRQTTLASLVDFYRDGDAMRAVVANAPADVAEWLHRRARGAHDDGGYDPAAYALWRRVTEWAVPRGVLLPTHSSYDLALPGEVARALRGPDYRAPFEPIPPIPPARKVAAAGTAAAAAHQVQAGAAAAAAEFADHLLAILDRIAQSPLPTVKTGGVGARELTRLARTVAAEESIVRLTLELADADGLLARSPHGLTVSSRFDGWRSGAPAERYASILERWWQFGGTPTVDRDADDKPRRVLESEADCVGCREARAGLVEAAAEFDGGLQLNDAARLLLWRHPLIHLPAHDDQPFASTWHEAETLGVLSVGAVTGIGHALLERDGSALVAALTEALPASSDTARFGADLTVFVTGAPSHRVSAILDSAADRESRGGAVTWRFTPATVRRALDAGTTGDQLLAALTAIASAELPQPLRYLVGDVARRHGHLRVGDAVGFVLSQDEPLLAELAASRKFAKFGLRLIAPTVLAADVPTEVLLTALRGAGYFPVPDQVDRSTRPESQPITPTSSPDEAEVIPLDAFRRRRGGASRTETDDVDPVTVARALIKAGVSAPQRTPVSTTELALRQTNRHLADVEVRQLAHAIDSGTPVIIHYESSTGAVTTRVIDSIDHSGTSLYAWCELRQDERWFTVSRIIGVEPV